MSDRCRESTGDDGADAPIIDLEGGRKVTRAFTAEAGFKPPLIRDGVLFSGDGGLEEVGLKGEFGRDIGREVPAVLAITLLVPETELPVETLRCIVALLFTLAFGLSSGGDIEACGVRGDDEEVGLNGEPGLDLGVDMVGLEVDAL